ncbi:MAG: hypothetical protein KIS87_10330 [Phycisphaeraceae bacterium]|nr:hypothetical protein [Phycisphaeraceae bacterium]
MIGHAVETIGGLYALARLGLISRFRFRGAYWRWRLYTAFGQGTPASRVELVRAILRYGRWMHRMKRLA